MFNAPYNYPRQNYKTNPTAPYPTAVDNSPYRKRKLVEAVLMGNLSLSALDEVEAPEYPADVDCNECAFVVDAQSSTYINPVYAAEQSQLAAQSSQQAASTATSTTLETLRAATHTQPSREQYGQQGQGPQQTASADRGEAFRKYLYGV